MDAGTSFTTDRDVFRRNKWNGWGSKQLSMKLSDTDPTLAIHPNGKPLPSLIPFINQELHGSADNPTPLRKTPSITLQEAIRKLPAPIVNKPFLSDIGQCLSSNQIALDGEARLSHAVGKNYRDLWRIRNGMFQRLPDAILLPQSHEDVVKIVDAAHRYNVCLIPFGGGTNVVGAIEADPTEVDRMVVSLDLRRMNRMKWIEKESSTACFEAGVLGPDLEEQLARYGYHLGHDPDSHVHSTLGGWIATRSSGAQSNRYGEMEEMVVSLTIVTPRGVITTPTAPRSVGMNLKEILIGSEGVLGVITMAVIKVVPIPEVRHYEGWLVPSFEIGSEAFRSATDQDIHPATFRLYDDDETRLSFAMKFQAGMVQNLVSQGIKQYAQRWKKMDLEKVCLAIIGYEGAAEDVALQKRRLHRHLGKYRALCLGTSPGKNWQEKKYDLPYIRDFTLDHGLWADVFETCTDYSRAMSLWRDVKQAVRDVWKQQEKRGWIGCHLCHQYKTGVCLYFTFAAEQNDENDIGERFLPLKKAAMEAIIRNRGALTHHHGVGYEHVPWMERYNGKVGLYVMQVIKQALDPKGICNPGKLLPLQDKPGQSDEENKKAKESAMLFYKMGVMEHIEKKPAAPSKSKL